VKCSLKMGWKMGYFIFPTFLKHKGKSESENLAFSCVFCNRHKGSDIGSIFSRTNKFIRFFNPRIDRWGMHFQLNGVKIQPITEIGEVTAQILKLNNGDRLLERQELSAIGRYPTPSALAVMSK